MTLPCSFVDADNNMKPTAQPTCACMYKSNASRSALLLYDWNTTAVNKFVQTIKDANAKKKKNDIINIS